MDRAGTLATNGMATGLGADLNGGTVVSDSSTTSRGAIDSGGASDSIRAVLMVKPTTAREQARDLGRDGEPTSGRAGTVVAAAASAASHPHTGYTEFSNHLSLNTHVLPQLQTTDLGDILSSLGPLPPTGLASTDPAPDFQPVLDVDKPVEVFSYFYTKLDSLPLGPPVTSRTPSATSKSDQSGLRSDQMSFLESGPTSIAQSPFTSPPHSRNGSISLQSTRLSATEAATAARVVGHGSGKLGTLPASPLGPSQTGFVPPPAVVAAPPSLFAREPMWNTPSQTPSSQLDGGVSTPGSLVLSRMETDTAVSNGKGFALLARSDASVSIDSRGSIGTPSTSSMAFGSPSLAPAVLGAAPTLSSAASVTALPDRDRYGFRHPQFPPAAHRVALDRHYKGVLTRRRARWDALIASEPRRWSRSRSMRRKSGDQITSHPEPVTSAGPWSEDAEGRIDWGTGWWMPYRRRKYLDRPADSTGVVTNTQLTKREWEWDDGGDTGERIKRYVRKGIPPEVRGRAWLEYSGASSLLVRTMGLYEHLLSLHGERPYDDPAMENPYLKPSHGEASGSESKPCWFDDVARWKEAGVEYTEVVENSVTVLERDVPRTFPDNSFFALPPLEPSAVADAGTQPWERNTYLKSLRRVLLAFISFSSPRRVPQSNGTLETRRYSTYTIGYCQGLNYVAGLLLVAVVHSRSAFLQERPTAGEANRPQMPTSLAPPHLSRQELQDIERITFSLLVQLVDGILPRMIYSEDGMAGAQVEGEVLLRYLINRVPGVERWIAWMERGEHSHKLARKSIKRAEGGTMPPVAVVTMGWMLTLFVSVLPVETTLRVWDCLFFEGYTIIHRVILTLFLVNQEKLLNITDGLDAWKFIKEMPSAFYDPHPFLDLVFRSTSPLTRIRIPFRSKSPTKASADKTVGETDPVKEYSQSARLRSVVRAKGVGKLKESTVEKYREAVWDTRTKDKR